MQARLEAEKRLHRGFVEAYELYRQRAEADPAWAEANPFFYEVERVDGRFDVRTNAAAGAAAAAAPVPLRQEIAAV